MLRRESEVRAKDGKFQDADRAGLQLQEATGLHQWLTKGNVIYKSVGLGLMDVVVGRELVRLARQRGIGTTIQDF